MNSIGCIDSKFADGVGFVRLASEARLAEAVMCLAEDLTIATRRGSWLDTDPRDLCAALQAPAMEPIAPRCAGACCEQSADALNEEPERR